MQNNKIVINITDGKIIPKFTMAPMAFDDLLSVLFTVALGAMQNIVDNAETETMQLAAKGALYDMFNVGASHTLSQFAPEFELRPNLTTQAIMEAENRIISEGRLHTVEAGT